MIFLLAVCAEVIEFLWSEWKRPRYRVCGEAIKFLRRAANCDFVEFLPFAVCIASVKFLRFVAYFVVRLVAMEFLSFAARIVAVEFQRLATRAFATEFLQSAIHAVFAPPYDAPSD